MATFMILVAIAVLIPVLIIIDTFIVPVTKITLLPGKILGLIWKCICKVVDWSFTLLVAVSIPFVIAVILEIVFVTVLKIPGAVAEQVAHAMFVALCIPFLFIVASIRRNVKEAI